MITFFFMILCWAILQLCASLFALLNLTFLKTLISKASFDIACTGFFVSMGLFITTQTQHIIQQIRVILLLICRYLLIPLSLIGIIFVITSLIVFTQQHVTLNQTLLLSVAFLCVTFVNGTYQDANINQLPRFLLKLIKLFLWITPIFTLLALYALIFQGNNNIAGHGINVGNFVYLITILLLLTYNIAYAIIALRQQSWLINFRYQKMIGGFKNKLLHHNKQPISTSSLLLLGLHGSHLKMVFCQQMRWLSVTIKSPFIFVALKIIISMLAVS
jgi:hypothetical protein